MAWLVDPHCPFCCHKLGVLCLHVLSLTRGGAKILIPIVPTEERRDHQPGCVHWRIKCSQWAPRMPWRAVVGHCGWGPVGTVYEMRLGSGSEPLARGQVGISSTLGCSRKTCATQDYVWNVIWSKPVLIQTFLQLGISRVYCIEDCTAVTVLLGDNKLAFQFIRQYLATLANGTQPPKTWPLLNKLTNPHSEDQALPSWWSPHLWKPVSQRLASLSLSN